jgi:hypothetical protein
MKSTLQFHSNQFSLIEEDTRANTDDFPRLFARKMTGLLRLSLLLTNDAAKAELSLILAKRECFVTKTVSQEWPFIWARRAVVRIAVHLVSGTENARPDELYAEVGPDDFHLQPSEFELEDLRDSLAILALPDFERLVFVICVLERYSVLNCSLLLKRSPNDVNDARVRAINHVVSAEERNRYGITTTPSTSLYGGCSNDNGDIDDFGGSLLD